MLIPYVIDPTNPAAWALERCYFPVTYYFYCAVLLLCYAGTVMQWNRWKNVSWVAAIIVIVTMIVPVLNAWLPTPILNDEGVLIWQNVVVATSISYNDQQSITLNIPITLYAQWAPIDFYENGSTYTINTAQGWNQFCDALQDTATYHRFSGKTVKLGANISVTRMAGSSGHDFMGTFDG